MSLSPSSQQRRLSELAFTCLNFRAPKFTCPLCCYRGPFKPLRRATGLRRHARCPRCDARERHRLQHLVLSQLLARPREAPLTVLHVAPETYLAPLLRQHAGRYETADLEMPTVDHRLDLQDMPLPDSSYDLVYASHVLEHVPDDQRALSEIRRILRPNGIAILPVPVVGKHTVEYARPNPDETFHVRAPGLDYFDRYHAHFARVELYRSADLPGEHQLWIYEDRSRPPSTGPFARPPVAGERHEDVVPVCYA